MTASTIPTFTSALAAIRYARKLLIAAEEIVDFVTSHDEPAILEPSLRLLSVSTRECLERARGLHMEPKVLTELEKVHRALVFVNESFYLALTEEDRQRLASARGFQHAEHVEWTPREKPALVFWLNDAYPQEIIEKVRVQVRAYRRAGDEKKADEMLLVAEVTKRLAEAGKDADTIASVVEEVSRTLAAA